MRVSNVFLVDKCKIAFIASKFCCLQPLLKFFLIICSYETTSDENLKMHIQILLIRGEAKQVLSTSMFYMLASQRAVICNWGSQRTKNKHCETSTLFDVFKIYHVTLMCILINISYIYRIIFVCFFLLWVLKLPAKLNIYLHFLH